MVLGLVFRVAVYQNNELPDNVRGANPEAFVITTEAPMRAPIVEDVLDHDEAWRLAVQTLSLEEAYMGEVMASWIPCRNMDYPENGH